jgi:hypothetical protein
MGVAMRAGHHRVGDLWPLRMTSESMTPPLSESCGVRCFYHGRRALVADAMMKVEGPGRNQSQKE